MGELAIINKALESPRLRDKDMNETYQGIVVHIGRIHALRGIKLETEDLRFMGRELTRTLYERFPGLTVEEIGIALDKGIKKDFGEYYGLNVIIFLDWIKAYQYSEARAKAMEVKYQKALPPKVEPTPEEKRKITIEAILRTFSNYATGGIMPRIEIFSGIIYDDLVEMGLINDGNEAKWDAIHKAEQLVYEDKSPLERKRKGSPLEIGKLLDKGLSSKLAVTKAKAILLERYFADLVKQNIQISDLLPE